MTFQSGFTCCFTPNLNIHPCRRVTMGLVADQGKKAVWVWTKSKDVMTASIERGWDTFVFTQKTQPLCEEWKSMAKIRPLLLNNGKLYNEQNEEVALFAGVSCAEDLEVVKSLSMSLDTIVMDAVEWQIINAENMVAFFQNRKTSFFATARSAHEAQLFLESLEKGTDGVVLQTEEPSEVFMLKAYLASKDKEKMLLQTATVKRVEAMGMGDRVCVDVCNLLVPGEGLLVGSFARGLFLVHAECLESNYVASRPFRINAGPVHAYVAMPGGKTSYLAELQSGVRVLIVDAYGRQRTAIVGRVKIESRPLILVEAVADNCNSTTYSLLLQNAETVNLVCPPQGVENEGNLAIPVTNIKPGDKVLISVQETAARHTGIAIHEFISEK